MAATGTVQVVAVANGAGTGTTTVFAQGPVTAKGAAPVLAVAPTLFRWSGTALTPYQVFEQTAAGLTEVYPRLQTSAGTVYAGVSGQSIKPGPRGLMDRWQLPSSISSTLSAVVTTYVIQVLWKDLQLTAGGAINLNAPTYNGNDTLSGNTLAQELVFARAIGASVRLRVMCGYRAPAWVKAIGGTELTWYDTTAPTATMGRWWHPTHIAAIDDLQAKLSALFDADPIVGDIVISGPMTIFSEIMIRQTSAQVCRDSLLSTSGETYPYSKAADIASIQANIDIHAKYWKRTKSSLACNPYQYVVSATQAPSSDVATTKVLIDYLVGKLGARAVVGNHSMRDNQQDDSRVGGKGGDMVAYNTLLVNDLYPYMAACPAELYIQTDAASRLGRLASATPTALTVATAQYLDGPHQVFGGSALDQALHFGAASLELPKKYELYGTVGPGGQVTSFDSLAQATAYQTAFLAL